MRNTYYVPSTVLGAGKAKAQSLVSVACHLAKTDTETNYYSVVNTILSKCPGISEKEPETGEPDEMSLKTW